MIRYLGATATAHCHNATCEAQRLWDGEILVNREWDTGAWTPESCPACGDDLHEEPWTAPAEFVSEEPR